MALPDIALIKTMARIDGDEFDAILPTLIESATALASHEVGIDYTVEDMPAAVTHYIASHVSYWLNNTDAAAEKQLHPSPFISHLLDPYRTWSL